MALTPTLRVRTHTGWTTKPVADDPANALTAEEVDGNFLHLQSLSMPVHRVAGKEYGGVADGGTDQAAAIQNAVDAAETAGGGVVLLTPGVWLIQSAIELGDNVTLQLAAGSILRRDDTGTEFCCVTNKDRTNGNTRIGIVGPGLIDGNAENASAGQRYSAVHFAGVTDAFAWMARIRGGCRRTASSQPFPGAGEGLELVGCGRFAVVGGAYSDNHYDGIKFRNSHHCSVHGASGLNNSRGLVQITGESGNVEPTGSTHVVVTGCTAQHDNGQVAAASEAPYTSGYALHSGKRCTIVGNTAEGMLSPIDALENANENVVADNYLAPRGSVADQPALWFRQYSAQGCSRNEIHGNTIRPIDGSGRVYIHVDGDDNTIFDNRLLTGGGTGTWTNENSGDNNQWRFNRPASVSLADTGTNTDVLSLSAGVMTLNGEEVQTAADTTAPTLSSPSGTATGSTTADGSVSTDEGNGTLYWVTTTSATKPSVAQVQTGQDHNGAAAAASDNQSVSATGTQNISATGLTAGTTYYHHYQHKDAAGNDSTVASSASFDTQAAGGTLTEFTFNGLSSLPAGMTQRFDTTNTTISVANDMLTITNSSGNRTGISIDAANDADPVEILFLGRFSATGESTYNRAFFAGSGVAGSEDAYVVSLTEPEADTVAASSYNNGSAAAEGVPQTITAIPANTWYWTRARRDGTTIKIKCWEQGSAEPGTFQFTASGLSGKAGSWNGIFAFSALTFDFDYVAADSAGNTIPVPGST